MNKADKDNLKRIMDFNKKRTSQLPSLAKSNLKTFKEKDKQVDDVRESEEIVKRISLNKPRFSILSSGDKSKQRLMEKSPASVVSFGQNEKSPENKIEKKELERKSLLDIAGFRKTNRLSSSMTKTQVIDL
mmetsp:Transcript_29316/g.44161  ORF Transcript_29316/g.44161 Transcript_29316/m.44161 type:complete len:131 (+) Transcript_29316:116-508(+)